MRVTSKLLAVSMVIVVVVIAALGIYFLNASSSIAEQESSVSSLSSEVESLQQAQSTTTPGRAHDNVTVVVSHSAISGNQSFVVSGNVTAASGNCSGTVVVILITNPVGTLVTVASAQVNGSGGAGTYSQNFATGGSKNWVTGTYTVKVSYDTVAALGIPAATALALFAYSQSPLVG